MSSFPESAVHKVVPLRFAGLDLQFKTSHALFSHHHVDDGTMLLLKTLAQQNAVPAGGRALDAGCGYGPLALALKKHRPALEVSARDRLALAAAFTAENARFNGLVVDTGVGLLLDDVPGPWDLIVSNLPAKAGEPVLADFVPRSLGLLSPEGLVAVVIVETLASWFATRLDAAGALRVFEEKGPGYRVFHYRRAPGDIPRVSDSVFPEVYRRGEVRWTAGTRAFVQKTFFGLPNFDALDYRTQVTLPLLEGLVIRGDVLVWEPVQGHLATWADAVMAPSALLHLAGNDALGLLATRENVARKPTLHGIPSLADVSLGSGSLGAALVQFHPEPEVPWIDETREALLRLVAPGGLVVINGASTEVTRFLERHKGLRKRRDERSKGWRAVVLDIT